MKSPLRLVKTATDLAFTGGWTTCCFFLVTVPLAISPRGTISQWIVRKVWAPGLLRWAGARVLASGLDNIEPGRSYVFMANHQSHFDVLTLFRTVPLNLRFVTKKELVWIPFFGPYLYLAGFPLVDRSNRQRAIRSLDRAAEKIRQGIPIVTFPEGTRSRDGRVHPFKKGPFMLALKAGVPIIPVAISGTDKVLPARSVEMRPGTIRIRYGEPVDVNQYGLEGRDRLMEDVRRIISDMKAALDARTSREDF